MTVPTTEPAAISAGDTIAWTRTLDNYLASDGWTLSYALRSATGMIDITASAIGADHAVSVAASVSKTWAPGTYAWAAFVTKAAERYEVGRGSIVVRPNLAAPAPIDSRSQAAKAVEDLRAALATFKATGGRVRRYAIAGRDVEFETLGEMMKLLSMWQRELANEEAIARLNSGKSSPLLLQVRL
jgi:hypothetical protein